VWKIVIKWRLVVFTRVMTPGVVESKTHSSETYATFRNRLKTELFQKSYDT